MTESRRKILERRAAFVAAAIGAIAAGADCSRAQACLSAVPEEKTKPGPDAATPIEAGTNPHPDPHPEPCLSEVPTPPPDAPTPMPCLKIAMPRDAGPPAKKDAAPIPCLEIDPGA